MRFTKGKVVPSVETFSPLFSSLRFQQKLVELCKSVAVQKSVSSFILQLLLLKALFFLSPNISSLLVKTQDSRLKTRSSSQTRPRMLAFVSRMQTALFGAESRSATRALNLKHKTANAAKPCPNSVLSFP